MRTSLAILALAAAAAAQIPTDAVVVLEDTVQVQDPNYKLIDPLGRGLTSIRGQNVFLQPAPLSVAVDPVQPGYFYFQANPASFAGTWRFEIGALATISQSVWGAWLRTAGERVEAGPSSVFTLRNGIVEACVRVAGAPQSPVTLFTLLNASDLAARDPFLYVSSYDPISPAPLIEYNLLARTQRTVGNYLGVRAIAADPTRAELLLGTEFGELIRIDQASGTVLNSANLNQGAVLAVGFTSRGVRLFSTATQLFSDAVNSGPIYQSSTAIRDFAIGSVPAASIVPYGEGCGAGASATWASSGLPTLGNAGFRLGLRSAPPSQFAILLIGADRAFSAALGAPLPFSLQPFGAAGCNLLADPLVTLVLPTTASGSADQTVPIPTTRSLASREFVSQWFVPDSSVGALGLATTEGVAWVVR